MRSGSGRFIDARAIPGTNGGRIAGGRQGQEVYVQEAGGSAGVEPNVVSAEIITHQCFAENAPEPRHGRFLSIGVENRVADVGPAKTRREVP